jgi:KDO2-lipid IV(A) lauroyltransferase
MPLRWVQKIAAAFGLFAYRILGFRRRIVRENLRNAFPNESADRLEDIAMEVYRNVATSLCELLWFRNLTPEALDDLVELNDVGLLRSMHARGKGIVIVTAHLGNWEFISPAVFLKTGIQVHALYKPQSNIFIDKQIAEWRTRFGSKIVPMGLGVREILRALQEGDAVLVAADQSAPVESIHMEFFGRLVPVFQGPAAFSLKAGAPMISVFAIRRPDGRYLLRCKEVPTNDLSYSDEGIRDLTQRHLELTEAVIKEYPGQWMWTHRRWKHAKDVREEGKPL